MAEEKAATIAKGVALLFAEIDSRSATGQPPILKTAAEDFLMKAKYTRQDARSITASDTFVAVPRSGQGNPVELHRHGKDATAEMRERSKPNENADSAREDFRHPHLERTAEINRTQTRMNRGDSQPTISAADTPLTDEMLPAIEPGNAIGEGLFFDLEA